MPPPSLTDEEKWFRRHARKGRFYLIETRPSTRPQGHGGENEYVVLMSDGTDVKLSICRDGMWLRYGPDTLAKLRGTSITGLWQSSPGTVTDAHLAMMLSFAKGDLALPPFDLRSIRDARF